MQKITFRFNSDCIGTSTTVEIVLPRFPDGKRLVGHQAGKVPCLYLLHGLSDDATIWSRMTHVERLALEKGIAVVMPDGARSFYCNMVAGGRYLDYISQELPRVIEATFPVSSSPEDRYIAGNSMGGYGAMKVALRNEGFYAGVAAFSPVTDLASHESVPRSPTYLGIFGNESVPEGDDLFRLIDKARFPEKLYLGIGDQDFLYEENARFRAALSEKQIPFLYREEKGIGHSWVLWEKELEEALEYFFPEKECTYEN